MLNPKDFDSQEAFEKALRDYFAAKALAGICASDNNGKIADIAKDAYAMADALLQARKG